MNCENISGKVTTFELLEDDMKVTLVSSSEFW